MSRKTFPAASGDFSVTLKYAKAILHCSKLCAEAVLAGSCRSACALSTVPASVMSDHYLCFLLSSHGADEGVGAARQSSIATE